MCAALLIDGHLVATTPALQKHALLAIIANRISSNLAENQCVDGNLHMFIYKISIFVENCYNLRMFLGCAQIASGV